MSVVPHEYGKNLYDQFSSKFMLFLVRYSWTQKLVTLLDENIGCVLDE